MVVMMRMKVINQSTMSATLDLHPPPDYLADDHDDDHHDAPDYHDDDDGVVDQWTSKP